MLFKRLFKFFTSLRLTVVLLAFAIILVFVGTVAQANEGLYRAQARYFKEWLVIGITMFGKKIPILLPGGYLLGTLLLINLLAAHIQRFQFTRKKLGIHLAHAGIILLLVGQLVTDLFSRESQIRFFEGDTRLYSESMAEYELAFVTGAGPGSNEEMVIPGRLLAAGGELQNEKLPFALRIKSYWPNSEPSFRAPMMQNGPSLATNGIAAQFDFTGRAETTRMDDKNVPTALIEIIGPNGSLGDWVVSGWAADDAMKEGLEHFYTKQMGGKMARNIVGRLGEPQSVAMGEKEFTFALRPARIYNPFGLTLLKATHEIYPGSDTPKDFRSRVRLENPRTGENREVEIFMNQPLRYAGLTFYQYQMTAGEAVREEGRVPSSVLQVVRNPGWLTPYFGCSLVAIGLVVQFMTHLIGFIAKAKTR